MLIGSLVLTHETREINKTTSIKMQSTIEELWDVCLPDLIPDFNLMLLFHNFSLREVMYLYYT